MPLTKSIVDAITCLIQYNMLVETYNSWFSIRNASAMSLIFCYMPVSATLNLKLIWYLSIKVGLKFNIFFLCYNSQLNLDILCILLL